MATFLNPAAQVHGAEPASTWVTRWAHLAKPRGRVLDVACGYGRHAYYFHQLNHSVTLLDRAQAAIDSIMLPPESCEKVVADIENAPWPLAGMQFDAVVVTNYLWRPLIPALLASLAVGGVLIYETFTEGNETVGKPSRSEFLLRPGELLQICKELRVVAFEDGFIDSSGGQPAKFVQRIAAVRQTAISPSPTRFPLA
jgi:SAM-dependent methyltransferase